MFEIDQAGGKAIVVYCDHSDSEQIRQLFEQIDREQKGQLDILVNNAFSAVAYIIGNPYCQKYSFDYRTHWHEVL